MDFREAKDSMVTVRVPADAYFGPQTQRAVENFPISGLILPAAFMHALALIKQYAARVNAELGLLNADVSKAFIKAAQEVMDGKFDDQFVVDVFQTGSGTSTNMNMNEVIASRANEIITGKKGDNTPVHPNDHVNLGQSSNDVIPSTIHIAASISIKKDLIPSLDLLHKTIANKAAEFDRMKKIGRTHLQDAVPMTLGDEFSGYARQIELGIERVALVVERLAELALGGTAVGTGLNTHADFAAGVRRRLEQVSGLTITAPDDRFEAQANRDSLVELSGALKVYAVSLNKIANDLAVDGVGAA